MKKELLLLAFLASAGLFGQTVNLQWNGKISIDAGQGQTMDVPKVNHYNTDLFRGSMFISFNQEIANAGITNPIWEEISENDLYSLNKGTLPSNDIMEVTPYFDTEKNKQGTRFFLLAFKRVKDKVYRLKSFSIGANKETALKASSNLQAVAAVTATSNNPLQSGTFYKIKVDKSGVFKITSKFLKDNGINPSSINTANFRIYGNGGTMLPEFNQDFSYPALQENAIEVVDGGDGKWDDGDYALFYAQGPDGFNLYNQTDFGAPEGRRTETRNDPSYNVKNVYEDYAYYYINFDIGQGKRVQTSDIATPNSPLTRYNAYQFINEDKNNLMKVGRIWVGDMINGSRNIVFNTQTPINGAVKVRTRVVAFNANLTSVSINTNGNQSSYTTNNAAVSYIPQVFDQDIANITGNAININLTTNLAGNPTGSYYFDYAEAIYPQDLVFNGSQMNFRVYDYPTSGLIGFQMNNSANADRVWDLTDLTNAKNIINKSSGSTFGFGYNNDIEVPNEFVAFKTSAAFDPTFVGRIENQNLAGLSNVDYLIITRSDMVSQAQRISTYYKTKFGYNVEIVTPDKIYNEYSSGSQDVTAIRKFVTALKLKGSLKYVLILGDASYDYKNRIKNNSNVVPAYESEESADFVNSYVTDDYFAMTAPQINPITLVKTLTLAGQLPTIPVGRLPAANVAEAKLLIDKTLAYYNELPGQSTPFGDWRAKVAFVVDDANDGGTPFQNIMETQISNNFGLSSPIPEYNVKKLYLDAFQPTTTAGGQRFTQVTDGIKASINNGLYIYYLGHGGINGWSQKRVFAQADIQGLTNYNNAYSRFPLVSTITCEFTLWDDPEVYSAGEMMLKLSTGGAANMITSSRALAVSYGLGFTRNFTKSLFTLDSNNGFNTLGDAFLSAKVNYLANPNHLRVNYLGDPAMRMSRPKKLITVDKIQTKDGGDISTSGSVRALDFVTITGKITKDGTALDENFNGKIVVNIYDKLVDKKTLNNNNWPVTATNPLPYKEETSPIVRTTGTVKNGVFTLEFYVPKDINYTVGQGRLLLYADNWTKAGDNSYDVYYNAPIQVGGVNDKAAVDNTPPKVQIFMNNTNFADGGITNQNPTLLACITDDTGINSSGSGVGHDITAVLDGNVLGTYVLNDFYTSGEGNGCIAANVADYQRGSLSYPFSNLASGPHQLVFKVWDINNNSTTQTLNFVVEDDSNQNLVVKRLLNWPNPFTNKTYIQFEHNCNDVLDVNVQIYTITGKLVKTIRSVVTAEPFREGFRTPKTAIEWDGLDDYGDAVGKGTYIFKVFVKAQNQEKCKGSATQVEKMVLLK